MSNSPKLNLVELEALYNPPPVLRTEDRELYDKVRAQFMACLMPADILEWQLVNRLIDDAWFIKRYTRHQTVMVERRFQQSLEFQVQRIKTQLTRKEAQANRLAERMTQNPPEVAHLLHLEDQVFDLPPDVDEILLRTPTELEHNRALEKSIIFQEQLDRLIASATKRFNETLELLEHYKEGLGQRLRQAAEELLRPNNTEQDENPLPRTEALSIVPSGEGPVVTGEGEQTATSQEENK